MKITSGMAWCVLGLLNGLLLTGCVGAVVAGAATGGLVVYDRRSIDTIEKDARIYHLIHKAIVAHPQLHNTHIEVVSFNQVVLLAGQTSSDSERTLAGEIAQHTPKVRRVYNELSIGPKTSLSQHAKDTWITSQLRSQMILKKGLESRSIRVVTVDGVVYLMGIVTPEQSDSAVSVAQQIPGVRKVVKIFQYI